MSASKGRLSTDLPGSLRGEDPKVCTAEWQWDGGAWWYSNHEFGVHAADGDG